MEEFKKCSFGDKRLAVKALHDSGISIKEYKKFINSVRDLSIPKMMLKRGLLYGGVAAVAGIAVDLYRNNKENKTNSK